MVRVDQNIYFFWKPNQLREITQLREELMMSHLIFLDNPSVLKMHVRLRRGAKEKQKGAAEDVDLGVQEAIRDSLFQ